MRLNPDITNRRLIHAKGFLFLLLGLMSAGVLYAQSQNLRTLLLLMITVWAFCRFYYYLFYVLERYLGREKKYAGLWDALTFLARSGGKKDGGTAVPPQVPAPARLPVEVPVVLRAFDEREDHDAVVALWASELGYRSAHNDPALSIRKKLEMKDGLLYVARADGLLAGTVMAGYDGHRGWIYSLAVKPEFRNRGVGRALLLHAESALIGRGCVKINLQIGEGNERVVGFYEKSGYRVESRVSMGKTLKKEVD